MTAANGEVFMLGAVMIAAVLTGTAAENTVQADAISHLAAATAVSMVCPKFSVDTKAANWLLLDARIAPSEIAKDGRRFKRFDDEMNQTVAFIYQVAEDLDLSREEVACTLAGRNYGAAGTLVEGLLTEK